MNAGEPEVPSPYHHGEEDEQPEYARRLSQHIRLREQRVQREMTISREMMELIPNAGMQATGQVVESLQLDMNQLASEVVRRTTLLGEAVTAIVADANSQFQTVHQDAKDHQDVLSEIVSHVRILTSMTGVLEEQLSYGGLGASRK